VWEASAALTEEQLGVINMIAQSCAASPYPSHVGAAPAPHSLVTRVAASRLLPAAPPPPTASPASALPPRSAQIQEDKGAGGSAQDAAAAATAAGRSAGSQQQQGGSAAAAAKDSYSGTLEDAVLHNGNQFHKWHTELEAACASETEEK
jgi:hypothetical protein